MNVILLSGGSGRRLWPLSNEVRSKQFIKFFKDPEGNPESMVQRVYRQIVSVSPDSTVTVASSRQQLSSLKNHLGDRINISSEPCRRDTFPAIVLAVSFLVEKNGLSEDDPVIVCPVDPYVDETFFASFKKLEDITSKMDEGVCLLGIEPAFPTAKYGYIIPEDMENVSRAKAFKEKPSEKEAEVLIKEGALWNAGVFAMKAGYVLDKAREILGYKGYDDLYSSYESLEGISFDYAVLEKEKNINVLRYEGSWKDVGTWNTLCETMEDDHLGNVIFGGECKNTTAVNDLDIPLICMGLENIVVAAGPDGILVSDKHQSSYIKPIVDKVAGEINYSEKSWGSFKVIDSTGDSITIKVTFLAGHHMYYHSHERRDEVWTVITGEGVAIVDGEKIPVKAGSCIKLPVGCKHTIIAGTRLELIEVQTGSDISVNDKIKYEYEF